jgi:hypothetical protein
MCTVLLPPGGYPTAVNKYTISYQFLFPKSRSGFPRSSYHPDLALHMFSSSSRKLDGSYESFFCRIFPKFVTNHWPAHRRFQKVLSSCGSNTLDTDMDETTQADNKCSSVYTITVQTNARLLYCTTLQHPVILRTVRQTKIGQITWSKTQIHHPYKQLCTNWRSVWSLTMTSSNWYQELTAAEATDN